MGDSEKLEGTGDARYSFATHASHLDGFIDEVASSGPIVLVLHDWGSALGFDWARRNADRVAGIAYMESICGPVDLEDWPAGGRDIFGAMRTPELGEELVLEKNVFVERILPSSILRKLTDEEMDEYRRPFRQPGEDRRPTLSWPRELPFGGNPSDVHEIVSDYSTWMASNDLPKLYVHATPGFMSAVWSDLCRTWPNQTEVDVAGIHFVQEDSAEVIGTALAHWLKELSPE